MHFYVQHRQAAAAKLTYQQQTRMQMPAAPLPMLALQTQQLLLLLEQQHQVRHLQHPLLAQA
jgi:hypothetical protein